MLQWLGRRIARYLMQPVTNYMPIATSHPGALARSLRPADVLLIDGNTRVSAAIKYLTQSTWSHAALFVGPIAGRTEPDGEPHNLVEADLERGVVSTPLSRYASGHWRICRPVGLSQAETDAIVSFAVARIGYAYDLRNLFDLLRFFAPVPPIPARFRRRMIALGSGAPTRAICSTLIAEAFQRVGYPVLPNIEMIELAAAQGKVPSMGTVQRREILHIRDHQLYAPRDFDISPYFSIVKPTIEDGFDFRRLSWALEENSTGRGSKQ